MHGRHPRDEVVDHVPAVCADLVPRACPACHLGPAPSDRTDALRARQHPPDCRMLGLPGEFVPSCDVGAGGA